MNLLVDYLKKHSIDKLISEYGVVVKKYACGVYNISYTNYASPKFEPIVEMCRGIVIDEDYNILSRSFDRFYNYGEDPNQPEINLSESRIFDKVDGSFIKIWWFEKENRWCVGTRGTAFSESSATDHIDFQSIVYAALKFDDDIQFSSYCDLILDRSDTHMFELTSPYNRIVVDYSNEILLHYLGSRNNLTGEYTRLTDRQIDMLGVEKVKEYKFDSFEDMKEFNSKYDGSDVQEGFVIVDANYKPLAKVKSDQYMRMHYIRGEELTHRRIVYMLIQGEYDEYLTYFPRDRVIFQRHFDTWRYMEDDLLRLYEEHRNKTTREVAGIMKGDFRGTTIMNMMKCENLEHPLHALKFSLEATRYKLYMNYFNMLGHKIKDYKVF